MATKREPLPDLKGWEALTFQMAAFHVEGQPFAGTPKPIWQDVTGEEPSTTKRQEFTREEAGPYQKGNLTVVSDPAKIAFLATPRLAIADTAGGMRPPTLKPFPDKRDWFVGVMSKWLARCPPVYRLAFSAKLIRPAEGLEGVSKLLNSYLYPRVQVDPDPSEFIYRINRKCMSKTPGLEDRKINRLVMWSALTFLIQMQSIAVEPGTGAMTTNTPTLPTEFAVCSLDVDINTVQEQKQPLPAASLPQLLQELAKLGTDIAERGESNG